MLNATLHPDAEDLTAMLFNIANVPEEERVYVALENYSGHLCEEVKADLYALLAEQPLAELGRKDSVQKVSRCLWVNQQHYPRG